MTDLSQSAHSAAAPASIADASDASAGATPAWKAWGKQLLRLIIIAAVCWFLWSKIAKAIAELQAQGFSLASVDYFWLAASAAFYALGMIPSWWFWHTTLHAMGARPSWYESCRAHFIGHLGKYVPGKALVVVIRAAMVSSSRTNTTVAAVAVFIETLSLMAVGSTIAAGLIAVLFREHQFALAIAVVLMLVAGLPTFPPIFRRLVRWLKVKKANPLIEHAIEGVGYRLMAIGWFALTIEWLCFGLSLWATLKALPTLVGPEVDLLAMMSLLLASVTLSMVAGFMSLIPGGFGVRDGLLMGLLGPALGPAAALVAAGLLRIVWLLTEVAISIILYLAIRPPATAAPPPSDTSADPVL